MKIDHPVIVGGGIAGLATAWGLHSRGVPVTLLEQSAVFSDVGAGLQLGPNAVKALMALDLWDAVKPIIHSPPEIHVRDAVSGKLIQRIKLGQAFRTMFGADYGVAHRADLQAAILSRVQAVSTIEMRTDHKVETLRSSDQSITLGISGRAALECQLLLAADGIHSPVRQKLFPQARAVRLPYTFYRNLLAVMDRKDDVAMDCVNLWMGRNCHVVHYPVGARRFINVVAVAASTTSGTQWSAEAEPNEVEQKFSGVHDTLQRIIFGKSSWTKWPGTHVPHLPQWHLHRACLIGDAAHGTVPFLAQGAAMALEDAATAKQLYSATPEWFSGFELARKARTNRLDHLSRSLAGTYHLGQPAAAIRNIVMKFLGEKAFLARLAWIYAFTPE